MILNFCNNPTTVIDDVFHTLAGRPFVINPLHSNRNMLPEAPGIKKTGGSSFPDLILKAPENLRELSSGPTSRSH